MPHSSLSPEHTETPVDAPTPVVHLTRRARIEAERAAAASIRTGHVADGQRTSSGERVRDGHDVASVTGVADTSRASRPAAAVASFDDLLTDAGTDAGAGRWATAAPVSPVDLAPSSAPTPEAAAAPATPAAPVSPIDLAPASPAMPVPSATATPPAPTSPVVDGPTTRRVLGQVPPAGRRPVRPVAAAHVDRATRHLGASARRPAAVPAATRDGASFRRAASRVTAVGALLFAAGLVVSTSLPAQALFTPEPGSTSARTSATGATQSMSVEADAAEAGTSRDQYSVSSPTQYKHVDSSSFTNDPNGTIQWPFLTGVPITSGFGGRQVEGCSFCSTNHMGVDFAPGEGTPIRVIAGGTVTKVQAHDGGFGNDVWVEHDVDGKQFTSVYGHMEDDSFKVVEGQQVAVGDELGLVGSTGNSTGPHLHLEVHVDGVPVDPLAWLRANAN